MTNKEIVNYIKNSFDLKNQGFYKPAIEMLYKALALDNDNVEILIQLSHLYLLLGNYSRAVYYIEKALDVNNNQIDCLILLKEIYIKQGELQKAVGIAQKIYDLQPTAINFAGKIEILNSIGDFDKIKELEVSCSEMNDEVLYEFAYCYYKNYDLQKSIQLLEEAYSKNSDNQKVSLLLAKLYFETNLFEKSKKIFDELNDKVSSAEVLNYLGQFELNSQSFTRAIDYFSKAQKMDEKNPEILYNLASAYFLNGWLDEALKYFNQAICFDSENINYHYSLAYLYYQKKMYDKAMFELDFINSIEQHHELSNILRAMITAKNGDLLGAKTQLEKIIKYSEADDFAYFALGQVYKELSQLNEAKDSINKALELCPDSLQYFSELVDIEIELKNYDSALNLIEKLISINEKYVFAHICSAKINLLLKDFDRVYESAQEIIELDSNCPEGYYYNAIALFEQGDKDFAIESLKKSISIDLNNAILYAKMSEFYQELGDFKNAYVWMKEASEIDERNYSYKWFCAKIALVLKQDEAAAKYYTQAYRLGAHDKDLCHDYAEFLKLNGKIKQAEKILG